MRRLLTRKSHDTEVPMSVQYNIINLIRLLLEIITFVAVKCRQMKIFRKTAPFEVSKSQGTQNTETATQRCFTEMAV